MNVSWVVFAFDAKRTSMRRAVAERLAQTDPVVIVDRPVSVLRERSIPPLEKRSRRIQDKQDCWHYRPLHYPERLPGLGRLVKSLNASLLIREINRLLPQKAKRFVCYDSPTQYELVGRLGDDVSIYLAIDDRTVTVRGEPIKGELEAEKLLLGKVDKVICVSETLAEVLKTRMCPGPQPPIYVLPNAYDEQVFDPEREWKEPAIISDIRRPRVLIAGHISERIDWEGVMNACEARPEWTWVFVGPADPGMREKIEKFNVQLSGDADIVHGARIVLREPVPVEDMPSFIAFCDACAVPYRLNAFTLASSPLKATEYLAMGAPVLSTRIPSLERFGNAIEWVEQGDGQSYALALDAVKASCNDALMREARRASVKNESLMIRAEQFRAIAIAGQIETSLHI